MPSVRVVGVLLGVATVAVVASLCVNAILQPGKLHSARVDAERVLKAHCDTVRADIITAQHKLYGNTPQERALGANLYIDHVARDYELRMCLDDSVPVPECRFDDRACMLTTAGIVQLWLR